MQLVIAEKPSVAAHLAKVLGATKRCDGYFEGNQYYVTFVFGHLFTLYDAKDYDSKYRFWKVENLPIIPEKFQYKLLDDSGVKKQFKIIEGLIKNPAVTNVINACDADREGSLIFAETFVAAKTNKPLQRLWISSHTAEDIRAGFAKLKIGADDAPLTQAGYARQWADWLLGINLTVATTKLYATDKTVLKVGRVILPTVYLIYQRDMEIKNFKPRKYYELVATFQAEVGTYQGLYFKGKQTQFDEVESLQEILKAVTGQPGVITFVQTKRVTQGAPKLFNLTDLQGYITSKFQGFTAEKILKIAQSLYEKQYITYPRTASRYLDNSQLDAAQKSLTAVKAEFYSDLEITFKNSKSVFDSTKVDSHPALSPTHLIPRELEAAEKIVYQEIVKRFCAQFMPVAEYDQTEAITEVVGYQFQTKGKVLVIPGWKVLYGVELNDDDNEEPELKVTLKKQMTVKTIAAKTIPKETKPPAKYTVKSLLEAMQNCGKTVTVEDEMELLKGYQIGTSATRADVLKKLEQIGYIQLKGKSYSIAPLGLKLVELFPLKEMLEPDFTGRLEKQLKSIERGEAELKTFLNTVNEILIKGIDQMRNTKGNINKNLAALVVGKCPECGRAVIESTKGFGCTGYKEGCKFVIWKENPLLKKYEVSVVPKALVKQLLAKGTGECKLGNKMIQVTLEKTNEYWNLKFNFEASTVVSFGTCPDCGQAVVETAKAFGCTGYKEGCKFVIWKEDQLLQKYHKKVSARMAKDFLTKQKTKVKGLIDPKDQTKFEAELEFYKKERGYWGYQIVRKND